MFEKENGIFLIMKKHWFITSLKKLFSCITSVQVHRNIKIVERFVRMCLPMSQSVYILEDSKRLSSQLIIFIE